MTLKEAIEIGKDYKMQSAFEATPDFVDALKLLIETGKAYQKAQLNGWYPPGYKLPGETEE